jgi:hypothetical protein
MCRTALSVVGHSGCPLRGYGDTMPSGLTISSISPLLETGWSGMHHIGGRVSSHNADLLRAHSPGIIGPGLPRR